MCVGKIYKRSTALVVDFSVSNFSGTGITGLTVKYSIYDVDTSRYWDNASGAFDSVAEVLNTAAEIGDGLYNYVLTGGYALGGTEFIVHTEATDAVTGDTYDTAETYLLQSAPIDVNVISINGDATDDYNATLKLKMLDIENSAGNAISAVSTGGDAAGVLTQGSGFGNGLENRGGPTGDGQYNKGGSGGGSGMVNEAILSGWGTYNQANGSFAGIYNVGGATGSGSQNKGGSTSGHGSVNEATLLGAGQVNIAAGASQNGATFTKGSGGKDIDADEIGDLVSIEGSTTIDTRSITSMFELVSAMAAGRFQRGVPSAGKLTVYKADGTTPLIVFDVTDDERDPV